MTNEHRSSQTITNAGTLQLFPTRALSLQADSIDRATKGGMSTVAKSETNLRETRRDIDTVVDGESRLQELEDGVDGWTEGDQVQSNMATVNFERRPLWRLDRADLADRGMSPEGTAEIAQKSYVSTSSHPDVEGDRVQNRAERYSERRVDWLRGHAEPSLSPPERAMAQRGRLPRLLPYGQPHPRNPFRYIGTQSDFQVLEDDIAKLSLRNRL
ncbi:hypothetical protein B0O99DRAFT_627494 [Bisporella sp. PMI_857]|nr:hypothetical protein B0O99DRAFT_627494 [Bisporella sp. PMI_857]